MLLLLALWSFSASAQAQPDTTKPTVSLHGDADGATLWHLPAPLTGEVFDAGGMVLGASGQLTVRLYRNHSDSWQRWAQNGWVDIAAVDSHWSATVTATAKTGTYHWSADVPWPTGANLPPGNYVMGISAIDLAGNRTDAHRTVVIEEVDTTPPTVYVNSSSSDEEGARLSHLPWPLGGEVFDEGGMGGLLTVRFYRYTNGSWERWAEEGWIDLHARDSHWTASVTPSAASGVYLWSADVPWPADDDLSPGTYIVGVSAIDLAGNRTNAHRTLVVEEPAPTPALSIDAAIRGDGASAWLGEGFSNADAQGQTLGAAIERGQSQTRQIRIVRRGGGSSGGVRLTVPDGAAFAGAGWSARFYDAPEDGNEITAQITGADGWSVAMSDGESRTIRAEVTVPADAMAGDENALTLRAQANSTSETAALDVVKAIWNVVAPTPPVTPDLAIRAENAATWLGEEIVNADGAQQTLERVAKPGVSVQGHIKLTVADGAEGQRAKWSVPDWDAFAAQGWTARFFDVAQDDNEVTAQITGDGWTTPVDGVEKTIRFEATAPANSTDVTRVLSVSAQVGEGAADVVKLSLRVLPAARPDVAVSRLVEGKLARAYVGQNKFSPELQHIEMVTPLGRTESFAVKVTNSSAVTSRFEFEPLELPEGWQYRLYDALEAGNPIEIGNGSVLTPELARYESVVWRLEIETSTENKTGAGVPVRFNGAGESDECYLTFKMQGIAGAKYSLDGGITWNEVEGEVLHVPQGSTLGFEAIPINPDVPWPDDPFEPRWSHEDGSEEDEPSPGESRLGKRYYGAMVFLYHPTPTPEDEEGETATVECGNEFSVKVKVDATPEDEN